MLYRPSDTTSVLCAVVAFVLIIYTLIQKYRLEARRQRFKISHGCKPAQVTVRQRDPFGILLAIKVMSAVRQHRLVHFWHENLQHYGPTFVLASWTKKNIFTNHPENIKAVFATMFDDWAIEPMRHPLTPLLGKGIFTTDGAFWAHSRGMIRPQFNKEQVADLHQVEGHVQNLLKRIPTGGQSFDLAHLFRSFSLDASSEFLTGTSTALLSDKQDGFAKRFAESFHESVLDAMSRAVLGGLYHLVPHFAAWRANRDAKNYVSIFVRKALDAASRDRDKSGSQPTKPRYIFVQELARQEAIDSQRLRDESLNVLAAGQETTASLLSSLWFALGKEPRVWGMLLKEVDQLHGEIPTYADLKGMSYLKSCVQEALRLYPPVPSVAKRAIRDTVLPRGGGPDGESPIFVPKGSDLEPFFYSAMRQASVFGPDVDEFRPERWLEYNLRPGWNFTPFGGGPRTCLGQQYALVETYYLTTRMMQHFRKIESRDPEPWKESFSIVLSPSNGTKVSLMES